MRSLRNVGAARLQRPEFDELADFPARRITASSAGWGELGQLVQLAVDQIPALSAAGPIVEKIWRYDRESVWAFRRNGEPVGFYAMLYLNQIGLGRLHARQFDGADPSLSWLADPKEPAAAVYIWAAVATGLVAEGMRLVSRHLQTARYAQADLYALATTEPAARILLHQGFRRVPNNDSRLLSYVRQANRTGHERAAA
jgi:hypothetical protein